MPTDTASLVEQNRQIILEKRYYLKNDKGELIEKTPEQLFRRVAHAVAQAEKEEDRNYWETVFYEMMVSSVFLPNSPVLMNFGTEAGTGSACYVLDIPDNMMGIMNVVTEQAMIEKFGGGVGFSLSDLRPEGWPVKTTQGKACGPIMVLRELSETGKLITQAGRRDGAHLACMSVYHPNIFDFIKVKNTEGYIHNFNISVGIDQEFKEAVKNDGYLILFWPLVKQSFSDYSSASKYIEENFSDQMPFRTECSPRIIKARDIWNEIIYGAWLNGEPGLLVLDRANQDNVTPHLGEIKAANPCGESLLLDSEPCNLGSINLGQFISNGQFNFEWFENVISCAIRFLDNVVSENNQPTQKTQKMNDNTRKIGLGVMGFADSLIRLGIKYNSEEAVKFADIIGQTLKGKADETSNKLGEEKGDFPEFKNSTLYYNNGGSWNHMRNAWRLSLAPTGTISMIAGCSSGCEPLFSLAYKKHNMSAALENTELVYINEDLIETVKEDFSFNELEKLVLSGEDISKTLNGKKDIFVTTEQIAPEWHVKIQAAFQKYVDAGVSKTINLPNSSTIQDVEDAYLLAIDLGCKGITVYRQGSREKEVLVSSTSSNFNKQEATESVATTTRPKTLDGSTIKINTGHGSLYVTQNKNGEIPYEVISTLGKAGQCDSAYLEAISRLISVSLQNGVKLEDLMRQLSGIQCCPAWDNGEINKSPADAIARNLVSSQIIYSNGTGYKKPCPECGDSLVHEEGCMKCLSCFWSKCS